MPKPSRRPSEKDIYKKYMFKVLNLLRLPRFFISATRHSSFKFDYLTGNYVIDVQFVVDLHTHTCCIS